ncbi:MAG TPA: hypothetical protein VMZ33_06790, partial [Candidatus Limnocylindrales bacterium]|nr:hypothetical protein [Candidatus Limnocylindrales bacterium]
AVSLAVIVVILSTTSASAATATVTMTNYAFTAKAQTVRLGNSVTWRNTSTKTHTATPSVNWSWGGVSVAKGATSANVSPTQAGGFAYYCSIHPTLMKGNIKVPITVNPAGGNTATSFNLTLGTVKAPGVLVHDVYIRRNGGAWILRVETAEPSVSISFTQTGTWGIRTRLRYQLGGATSGFSPISTVVVF